MTTLRISITKEVLEATKDCESPKAQNCAISYAIRQIWPHGGVGQEHIAPFYYSDGGGLKNMFLHNQNKFIRQFDHSTPAERARMQPFSFDIEVPDEVIGEVNIEEIRRICEGSKTLEVV